MKTIPIIDANAVYTLDSLRETLDLKVGCLPREIRLKLLRAAKRAGRIFVLGRWALQWLESGEIRRAAAVDTNVATEARKS